MSVCQFVCSFLCIFLCKFSFFEHNDANGHSKHRTNPSIFHFTKYISIGKVQQTKPIKCKQLKLKRRKQFEKNYLNFIWLKGHGEKYLQFPEFKQMLKINN